MARYVLGVLGTVFLVASIHAEVPSYIQVCGRRNPNLDRCVTESVSKMMPKLKTGIKELGIPSAEPLHIGEVKLSDLPEFKAVANDVKLSGLSSFIIKFLKVDLPNRKIDFSVRFAKVNLNSDLNVEAKILVPIKDKALISMTTDNVEAEMSLAFEKKMYKGREHMFFNRMKLKLFVKDYAATFGSAREAESDPLKKAINQVLESSKEDIISSMVPSLEVAITKKLIVIANQICKSYTYEELFPDRT